MWYREENAVRVAYLSLLIKTANMMLFFKDGWDILVSLSDDR